MFNYWVIKSNFVIFGLLIKCNFDIFGFPTENFL